MKIWIIAIIGVIILGIVIYPFLNIGEKSDATVPDNTNPDTNDPATVPDANTPDTTTPDTNDPATVPDTNTPDTTTPDTNDPKTYSLSEVMSHSTKEDCWTVINGNVYDITEYIPNHPGGEGSISKLCGGDGSSAFTNKHEDDKKPNSELENYLLGALE
jgi:cytochrome b involved in lipid metabolism